MRIAITGAAGLLGHGLVRVFEERHEVLALGRAEADICDAAALREVMQRTLPDVVVHAAAIPDIDVCEEDPQLARAVNVEGTRNVVKAARDASAGVAFISTDAVFDGLRHAPYTEEDAPNPPTVYGRTKVEGERIVAEDARHWIFRVPLLFGPGKLNYVERGLRQLAKGNSWPAITDQMGGAGYTLDLARTMMRVIEANKCGLFHLSNAGTCSRYELARAAAEMAGFDPGHVVGRTRAEMRRAAVRLEYAVMEMRALDAAGVPRPRHWKEALAEYVASLRGRL